MSDGISPKPPKRPLLSSEFVRAMLAGHSALGLAFAALIYVVCLSGTLAVFVNELQRWEQPDAPLAAEIGTQAVTKALQAGYAQARADNAAHDLTLIGPPITGQRFRVSYHDHDTGVEGDWLADQDGNLVARLEAPFSEFLVHLHTHLHLPATWGLFIVGLTGVALLSSLVSGLLSHPRIFKDAFALRWGGSRRLQEADLHNRLGVWGLPFHIVVTLTGTLLGLSTLIVGVLALAAYDGDSEAAFATLLGPRAGPDESAAPLPDVAAMMRHVQSTRPDAIFASMRIEHAATAGQVVHLGMRTPGHIAFSDVYYFSGDGTPRGSGGLEDGSVGRWILGALTPLHFGWFGGALVKLLYGVLGLALAIVTHTGVTIWLARRRDKGRPVPGWEKVWAAVGWSQPLAFGITAGVALALGGALLLEVYLATVAAAFGLAWLAGDGVTAARALRLLSALAFIGAAGLHALVRSGGADPMAWTVNLGILACAAALALPLLGSGALRVVRAARPSSLSGR